MSPPYRRGRCTASELRPSSARSSTAAAPTPSACPSQVRLFITPLTESRLSQSPKRTDGKHNFVPGVPSGPDAAWRWPTTVTVTAVIMAGLLAAVFRSMVHCSPDAGRTYFHKEPLPRSLVSLVLVEILRLSQLNINI